MNDKFEDNDYRAFVSNCYDIDSLIELADFVNTDRYAGTPFDGTIPEGEVNDQYEVIRTGDSLMVYDKHNQEKVFITNAERVFMETVDDEIRKRCGGLDHHSWMSLQDKLSKDD
jgi:hypothetical protein